MATPPRWCLTPQQLPEPSEASIRQAEIGDELKADAAICAPPLEGSYCLSVGPACRRIEHDVWCLCFSAATTFLATETPDSSSALCSATSQPSSATVPHQQRW